MNNIFLPAINQIYYVNKENLVHSNLIRNLFNEIGKINVENLCEFLLNFREKIEYENYKKKIELKFKIKIEKFLNNFFSNFIEKNVTFINEKILENFSKKNNFNIIIFNENLFYLLIDEIIISNMKNKEKFSMKFYSKIEIEKNLKKNEKNFFCDYKIENLIENNKKFDCFTILLNCYSFCHNEKNEKFEEQKISNEIKNFFESNFKNFYKESFYLINKNIHFISNNFYQLNFYYKKIIEKNIFNYEKLCEFFNNLQPKILMLFLRTLTRKQEFNKQKFFISNEKILYKSHYGGNFVEINGKFDAILSKAVEILDLKLYEKIFENFSKFFNVNDPKKFACFVDKNKQSDFLKDFVNFKDVLEVNKKFNFKLLTIKYFNINLCEIFCDENEFLRKLEKNNIFFPIIIKFTSDKPDYKHLISIVFSKENFNEYLNSLKFDKNDTQTKCIIQEINNHSGYVMKIYHIGNFNYIDYRSSLPDLSEKFKAEFKEGFWTFKTIDLESENYRKKIWEKFVKKGEIEKIIENSNMKNYIFNIANIFEKFSNFSLFGIDLLLTKNETFFIIDCNSLPSYKIKGFNHEKNFRDFFIEKINKKNN